MLSRGIQLVFIFLFLMSQVGTSLLADETKKGEGARSLRVLSYNIHHGEGMDKRLDLERIAAVIRSVGPDIVALQEVDRVVKRSNGVDQPAELARLLNMTSIFEKNIDLQGGGYGNAILTNLPILGHRNLRLPQVKPDEARGVLIADLMWFGHEKPLQVLVTHFDHRPDPAERVASANRILELGELHDRPSLLIGDLNATIDSEPLRLLGRQWKNVNAEPMPTIPVTNPTRQIDFILTRNAVDVWKVRSVQVLEEKIASDHRPIFAILDGIH